ncbi:MAG TPA: bifunctional UDP-N-acetylglucosamine diphosphorylase/glucosamine-1-phosphate N-acetyltransferase GlmU [Candidatus Polarisedimenticolaceae bacterium]|nr:bifunctional UDP-N-acetylglucosamine diphosphorylase/glucosamine-1-phosphate N-acetyltransferase GlmU [Candidatus Polarisedimenticolaceae bacterium]
MAAAGKPLTVLVLAAGQGKRLRSKTIKLLHAVAGRPMIAHVLDVARSLRPRRVITVVGHQAEQLRSALGEQGGEFVLQREQRGTGHAVLLAAPQIGRAPGRLMILSGDVPTLQPATLRRLLAAHRRTGAALTLLTARVADPSGYGRIVRDAAGRVVRIVEDRDASAEERRIDEINCGLYVAEPQRLLAALRRVRPDNAQGEYYLTDAVRRLIDSGEHVAAVVHADPHELLGVNTRDELARASRLLYARKARELQQRGVTLLDPARVWIDPRARIGRDSVLYPDVIVEGASRLGEDCVIYPGCRIVDSTLGRGAVLRDHSVITQSTIGQGAQIGPFAHLRPGSVLEAGTKVGNFVELKQTRLGRGSKANHLTYLGDAEIGPGCNVGAGTITCNYDGARKHPTLLGRGVFVGSGTQLVAPVRVADGAYVAAGTTLTQDVPAGALAIARSPQANVLGWVARRRKRSR